MGNTEPYYEYRLTGRAPHRPGRQQIGETCVTLDYVNTLLKVTKNSDLRIEYREITNWETLP